MTTMQSPPVPPAPAATLEYANPHTRGTAPPGQRWLVFAVAVAAAFLGANAFADAAGFPPVRDADVDAGYIALRVLCAASWCFLLSLAVAGALLRAFRGVVGVLARTPDRPGTAVTLTMLICGSACVIGTLLTELLAMRWAARASMNMLLGEGIEVRSGAPLSVHLASLAAFAAGAALVGIGIWGSLGARNPGR